MKVPWKVVGLAGLAGVAATGAVVARRRRQVREDVDAGELRERLHARLAAVRRENGQQLSAGQAADEV